MIVTNYRRELSNETFGSLGGFAVLLINDSATSQFLSFI